MLFAVSPAMGVILTLDSETPVTPIPGSVQRPHKGVRRVVMGIRNKALATVQIPTLALPAEILTLEADPRDLTVLRATVETLPQTLPATCPLVWEMVRESPPVNRTTVEQDQAQATGRLAASLEAPLSP